MTRVYGNVQPLNHKTYEIYAKDSERVAAINEQKRIRTQLFDSY